ncbi:hypothetical protein [Treponema pectinovorum]|uniref:hypothetical protein n=1 Tax=Treponema pectinovorum TaxID=164 RepID=UPI0011CC45B6|nr:hypothetical protein [Treponema pectinovorum]
MKKILSFAFIILSSISTFAFDWPQNEIMSDSFFTYFAQLRGSLLSSSLIFSGSTQIKTVEKGYVTMVLSEHDEEPFLFESTLGNAVLQMHDDKLLTVYANLDSQGQNERYLLDKVEKAVDLGECGISGWQEKNALLEFQVIDLVSKTILNPRILMPRFGNELPLNLSNICAINKKGAEIDFSSQKKIASGTYLLYADRQERAMPYKTTVLVNGALADTITYDTIVQIEGKLCTKGKKNYPTALIYPDSKKQLLAEISIPKGKTKITLIIADILGKEKTQTYNLEVF